MAPAAPSVLDFIRPYPNVVDYQLLPYFRYGEAKYEFLGRVYELRDFDPPSDATMARLRAIINGGRLAQKA
jgi:pyruvate formate lyase activating enzyme